VKHVGAQKTLGVWIVIDSNPGTRKILGFNCKLGSDKTLNGLQDLVGISVHQGAEQVSRPDKGGTYTYNLRNCGPMGQHSP